MEQNSSLVISETRLLRSVAQIIVSERSEPFSRGAFFRNRPGLYVRDTFRQRLNTSAIERRSSALERSYTVSLLMRDAHDEEIARELGEKYLSIPEDIATFIEGQPNGTSGFLLVNGSANIFFIQGNGEVIPVDVRWSVRYHKWSVLDWQFNGPDEWGAGDQVLCRWNEAC